MKDVLQATTGKIAGLFLRTVIILIGIGTLAFLLWEPHLEGRNVNATFFEMYFKDPFLAYVYMASILFFVVLYQAFKVVGYAGQNAIFSQEAVKALRIIRYCAMALVALIVGAEVYLFIVQRGKDDIAGGVAMGLFAILISTIIAAAAAFLERMLQTKK